MSSLSHGLFRIIGTKSYIAGTKALHTAAYPFTCAAFTILCPVVLPQTIALYHNWKWIF